MKIQYLGEASAVNLSYRFLFSLHFVPFYWHCRMNFNQVNTWHIHYKNAWLKFYIVVKLDTNTNWELTLPLRQK